MTYPKNSLTIRTQAISLSDEDQRDELLRAQKAELLRHAESLLSTNKSVVLRESEPDIVEEDRAEHFPEVTSIEKVEPRPGARERPSAPRCRERAARACVQRTPANPQPDPQCVVPLPFS